MSEEWEKKSPAPGEKERIRIKTRRKRIEKNEAAWQKENEGINREPLPNYELLAENG